MREVDRQVKIQLFRLPPDTRFKVWFEIWLSPRCKLDFDNVLSEVMKFSLDGLQESGVLVDDSPKYIRRILGTVDYLQEIDDIHYSHIKIHFYEEGKINEV